MFQIIRTRSAAAALAAVALLSTCFAFTAFADDNTAESSGKYSSWEVVGPSGGDVRVGDDRSPRQKQAFCEHARRHRYIRRPTAGVHGGCL